MTLWRNVMLSYLQCYIWVRGKVVGEERGEGRGSNKYIGNCGWWKRRRLREAEKMSLLKRQKRASSTHQWHQRDKTKWNPTAVRHHPLPLYFFFIPLPFPFIHFFLLLPNYSSRSLYTHTHASKLKFNFFFSHLSSEF